MTALESRLIRMESLMRRLESAMLALKSDVDGLKRNQGLAQGGGLSGGGGPSGFLCRAAGGVSPRSGDSPGGGNVLRVRISGGSLETLGDPIAARNASATMMDDDGIDDGTYCWADRDAFGVLWVMPLECPDDVDPMPEPGDGMEGGEGGL